MNLGMESSSRATSEISNTSSTSDIGNCNTEVTDNVEATNFEDGLDSIENRENLLVDTIETDEVENVEAVNLEDPEVTPENSGMESVETFETDTVENVEAANLETPEEPHESSEMENVKTTETDAVEDVKTVKFNGIEETTEDNDFVHWINSDSYDKNGRYTGNYYPEGMTAENYAEKVDVEARQNYADYLNRRNDITQQEKNELYDDLAEKVIKSNEPNNLRKNNEAKEGVQTDIEEVHMSEKSPIRNLSDYMNRHNYGPKDFDEYSKDPEWRILQKEAFPDYELPQIEENELTEDANDTIEYESTPEESYENYVKLEEQQELIFQKLEEPREDYVEASDIFEVSYVDNNLNFWNEKKYSKEQYLNAASKISEVKTLLESGKTIDELRNDVNFADCVNAYYSEGNQIEVIKYNNSYIFQSDGRHRIMAAKEIGCEVPVHITYEVKEKDVVRDKIISDFENMGISYEGINDIPLERSLEIKESIEEMRNQYPEIKELLQCVEVTDELEEGTLACAGPKIIDNRFSARILVNKNEFDGKLEGKLAKYREKGYFAGDGNKAVLKHEMGHLLQLSLDSKKANLNGGDYITGDINRSRYNEMIEKWNSNEHADIILNNALNKLSLSRQDVSKELSIYGSTNSAEALAEAISEVNTSSQPRRLATEIVKEYEKLKQEMEGKE